jgi:hypothetical protein
LRDSFTEWCVLNVYSTPAVTHTAVTHKSTESSWSIPKYLPL